jgi:uncharacterized protein YlxW (UPF0749 family)
MRYILDNLERPGFYVQFKTRQLSLLCMKIQALRNIRAALFILSLSLFLTWIVYSKQVHIILPFFILLLMFLALINHQLRSVLRQSKVVHDDLVTLVQLASSHQNQNQLESRIFTYSQKLAAEITLNRYLKINGYYA